MQERKGVITFTDRNFDYRGQWAEGWGWAQTAARRGP
jgi:hypothetical protein